uniref:Aquaporin n=1 Tax=Oryza glumipatula TaxID=40148 RepID=A0A0D9Y4X4_9ORYZ
MAVVAGFSIREYTASMRGAAGAEGTRLYGLGAGDLPPMEATRFRWWADELAAAPPLPPRSPSSPPPPTTKPSRRTLGKARAPKKRFAIESGREMAGREDGAAAGAMEEGQDSKEVKCENSEDGSNTSRRCQGNDMISVQFMQKILTEILGTYFMIFAGCGAVVVNLSTGGAVTFPGICAVWGLVVTVLVYSVGHISGTHLNPAVTVAFATCGCFPWKQVPSYVVAQVLGSTMASLTLRVVARGEHLFLGTTPAGSMAQAAALEFVISFFLMFVVSSVATDNRAIGELAGDLQRR